MLVRDLAAALGRNGVENTVIGLADPASPAVVFPASIRCRLSRGAFLPRLAIPASPRIMSDALRSVREADVVHLHELWHAPQVLGGVLAQALRRPYVISPHGALSPWIGQQRKTLKRVAWIALQGGIVSKASGIHAVTSQERDDIRSAGIQVPVRVIPNGIDVGSIHAMVEDIRKSAADPSEPYVLFIGRLDPKKGLGVLIESFAQISTRLRDLRLILAGPDNQGMWSDLERTVARLGLANRVSYLGVVDAPTKMRLLARAVLFALPSQSEGMSIALLEALASGLPAIVSPQCNLPEVESGGAGRVVEPVPTRVADAILEVLEDESLRRSMARNAETLAADRFSVGRMASEMMGFYGEILSKAA